MQCACPDCGILMSLSQKGITSACTCPECRYECSACLGTDCVLSPEELRAFFAQKLTESEN